MFRSIRWRIALPYVVLILAIMLVVGVYISGFIRQTTINNLESKLTSEARLVGEDLRTILALQNKPANLDPQARNWANILGERVTIIAPDGTVLGESQQASASMPNHSDRPEVIQALASGIGSSTRHSDTLGYDMLYTAVRVDQNNQPLVLVRLALPLKEVNAAIAGFQRVLIVATGLVTVLAVIVATLIAGRISRPIRELTQSAWKLASSDPASLPIPPSPDEIGQLRQVFSLMSERLRGQIDDLKTERATLDTVMQKMTDGVIIVDESGNVQLVNTAAVKMFAITQEATTGKPLIEVVRHHQPVEMWQECRESGKPQRVDFEVGHRLSLQGIATPLGPTISGSTLLLFQDLSRQRQTEAMRRDFISNVSHELRTPLAALKALTETLQGGALEDPPAARRFLEQMETEVDSLSLMVSELLELSRIESGRVPLNMAPTPPKEIVLPAVERLRLQAERASLSLTVECPDDLPMVLADATRIQQVLVNLLHNAIKFTPTGGQVAVRVSQDERAVRFVVSDSGIGIAAEDLPRIFERFYKADRSRASSGTGLGLAIARHLVEAHGGRIWAESKVGEGSSFYFTIPVVEAKNEQPSE
jgi:two-component system, OmpR family, phosphate regulon sensor histidine kinase PhoR